MSYQPALINGDIGPYHILYNRTPPTNNGVTDFGVAGLGIPQRTLAAPSTFWGNHFSDGWLRPFGVRRSTGSQAPVICGTVEPWVAWPTSLRLRSCNSLPASVRD